MMSPIELMNLRHGEDAWLEFPPNGDSTDYDPEGATDFQPASPSFLKVRGHIGGDELVQGSNAEAKGAFTIEATALPPGLESGKTRLRRGGLTATDPANQSYLIVDYRERRFQGEIDGYTLFTGA